MTPQAVSGKAYFITNQEPKPFWGMMGDICGGLGYTRPHIKLPFLLIIIIAFIFEYIIRTLLMPIKTINSDFTVNRWGLLPLKLRASSAACKLVAAVCLRLLPSAASL